MPEGPECTIVAENLNEFLANKSLTSVETLSGRYLKTPLDFTKITNKRITSISNKGKFIYWQFEDDTVLFNTLGMSGTWSKIKELHSRVKFLLDKNLFVCYNDVRNFGTLKVTNQLELQKKLKQIGPDMLNNPCSYIEFKKIIQKYPNKILGPFLLDQKKLSSIGNIYKAEICYLAAINPSRNLSSLQEAEIDRLYQSIQEILILAYKCRGSSQKDYKDVDGVLGSFLVDYASVYKRKEDRLGNSVESLVIDGDDRTTWWCPNVQK